MKKKLVSTGHPIVRREVVNEHYTVVVACEEDVLGQKSYQWGIVHEGRVQSESFMDFDNASTALRDGLSFHASGEILVKDGEKWKLGKATAFVYPSSEQPEFVDAGV